MHIDRRDEKKTHNEIKIERRSRVERQVALTIPIDFNTIQPLLIMLNK